MKNYLFAVWLNNIAEIELIKIYLMTESILENFQISAISLHPSVPGQTKTISVGI